MPTTAYRVYATAPDGTRHSTQISLRKYTPQQAEHIAKVWRESVEEMKPFVKPSFERSEMPAGNPSIFPKKSFDLIKPDFSNGGVSFMCLGSTRSGKSTAMSYIYEKWFRKHITILMTHSTQADIYKPMKKNALISPGYFKELIDEPMKINRETKNNYDFCLVFDDLALDGKNSKEMTKLLTIGRNAGMSVIICGQKISMLNATGRSNINYICCFKQNTDSAVKDTVETYMRSYFPRGMKVPDMIRLYKELTQDHHFFVIDTLNDECFLTKLNIDSD
jgi:hypothetical protein